MKLKSQIMFAEIENETVGLPVGEGSDDFNGLIKVNRTARDIINLLKDDMTTEELVGKMLEQYDVPEEKLRKDIRKVVDALNAKGLIEGYITE